MTTFSYKGYLSTHKSNGDATKLKSTKLEVVATGKDAVFSYKRTDGEEGITITSPAIELRIDGKVYTPKKLDADIAQISWTDKSGTKGVANILVVELGDQQFTMQISGNTIPAFSTAKQYNSFVDSIVSERPLTFGFFGPGEKIPLDRIMKPSVTENDRILGTNGKNSYDGGAGNDQISGKGGNDILKGGTGNDKLYGGAGRDELHGGAGKDVFLFKSIKDSTVASSGRDTIKDFSSKAGDKIDLKAIDADTTAKGNQSFEFVGTKSFSGDAGELRYVKKGGDTIVFADVNGDKKSDFSILIDASLTLKAGDFIL